MNLEATFCLGNIDEINAKIIELPFQNKHLSMLIVLPKDVEDESTGLEKVRRQLGTWTGEQVRGGRSRHGPAHTLAQSSSSERREEQARPHPHPSPVVFRGLRSSLALFFFKVKTANICLSSMGQGCY